MDGFPNPNLLLQPMNIIIAETACFVVLKLSCHMKLFT